LTGGARIDSSALVIGSFGVLIAASASALVPRSGSLRIGLLLCVVASALVLAAAIEIVRSGSAVSFDLWSPAPYAAMRIHLDPLGAVFAAIIGGVGLVSSLFGIDYARHGPRENFVYPLFLLSMLMVTAAANVYTFVMAWECMALTSFILVIGDGLAKPQRNAAILYLGITHVATVFVVASFLILANEAGSSSFSDMALNATHTSGFPASLAFVFALVGFGTKAGLVPFHIWLPRAHPVAPSHVSALMSAAMVKTGIYGIVRVGIGFLGPGEEWWGVLLIGVGTVSALLGILYALMERDAKRVLAYSTVENVGIITIALGAAVSFRAAGENALASAALLAALLHCMNHAWFKTLLFLGAGTIQRSTHTLNLDRLGGLLKRMPATGSAMLAGSLAVAALPPFNGFVGEWMLLRSLVSLAASPAGSASQIAALAALGGLALTAGLAVACFVRLFGMAFLGLPRSDGAKHATEPSRLMYVVLCALALGTLATGVAAAPFHKPNVVDRRRVSTGDAVHSDVILQADPPLLPFCSGSGASCRCGVPRRVAGAAARYIHRWRPRTLRGTSLPSAACSRGVGCRPSTAASER
jgi:hydrogenase-4 component B